MERDCNEIKESCGAREVNNISEKGARDMCTFYSNKRRCAASNCPHIVGDLMAD